MSSQPSVQVCLRIRPSEAGLATEGQNCVLEVTSGDVVTLKHPYLNEERRWHGFAGIYNSCLHVAGSSPAKEAQIATQQDVHESMGKQLVQSISSGISQCVLTYGAAGTGKTFTLLGHSADPGLAPRVFGELVGLCKADKRGAVLLVSVFEIWSEKVFDLLAELHPMSGNKRVERRVREHPDEGQYVENLLSVPLTCGEDVNAVLAVAGDRTAGAHLLLEARYVRGEPKPLQGKDAASKHAKRLWGARKSAGRVDVGEKGRGDDGPEDDSGARRGRGGVIYSLEKRKSLQSHTRAMLSAQLGLSVSSGVVVNQKLEGITNGCWGQSVANTTLTFCDLSGVQPPVDRRNMLTSDISAGKVNQSLSTLSRVIGMLSKNNRSNSTPVDKPLDSNTRPSQAQAEVDREEVELAGKKLRPSVSDADLCLRSAPVDEEERPVGVFVESCAGLTARQVEGNETFRLPVPRRRKAKVPPHRDSVLTWLLKDKLTGVGCRTRVIVTVTSSLRDYDNTFKTLLFAERARRIALKTAVRPSHRFLATSLSLLPNDSSSHTPTTPPITPQMPQAPSQSTDEFLQVNTILSPTTPGAPLSGLSEPAKTRGDAGPVSPVPDKYAPANVRFALASAEELRGKVSGLSPGVSSNSTRLPLRQSVNIVDLADSVEGVVAQRVGDECDWEVQKLQKLLLPGSQEHPSKHAICRRPQYSRLALDAWSFGAKTEDLYLQNKSPIAIRLGQLRFAARLPATGDEGDSRCGEPRGLSEEEGAQTGTLPQNDAGPDKPAPRCKVPGGKRKGLLAGGPKRPTKPRVERPSARHQHRQQRHRSSHIETARSRIEAPTSVSPPADDSEMDGITKVLDDRSNSDASLSCASGASTPRKAPPAAQTAFESKLAGQARHVKSLLQQYDSRSEPSLWASERRRLIDNWLRSRTIRQQALLHVYPAATGISPCDTFHRSHERQYTSLFAACQAATDGDTVILHPGTHVLDRPVVINRGFVLTSLAESAEPATVRYRGEEPAVIIECVAGVVNGVRFEKSGGDCVVHLRGPGGCVAHCAIVSSNCHSAVLCSAGVGLVEDNDIRSWRVGVWVKGSGRAWVRRNRIARCGDCAVLIEGAGVKPLISENVLSNGRGGGVAVTKCAAGRVEGNEISFNGCVGVLVDGGASPVVAGNVIEGNGGGGVVYDGDGTRGLLVGNAFCANRDRELLVREGAVPKVEGNAFAGNGVYGAVFCLGGGAAVVRNAFSYYAGFSVLVRDAGFVLLYANTVRFDHNSEGGVLVASGRAPALIVGNTFEGPEQDEDKAVVVDPQRRSPASDRSRLPAAALKQSAVVRGNAVNKQCPPFAVAEDDVLSLLDERLGLLKNGRP